MSENGKVLHDQDVLGTKADASHEERMHWGALTEEELVIEKKLKLRVDFLIMPLIILIYLMNYIDRCVFTFTKCAVLSNHWDSATTMQQRDFKVLRKICTSTGINIKLA